MREQPAELPDEQVADVVMQAATHDVELPEVQTKEEKSLLSALLLAKRFKTRDGLG